MVGAGIGLATGSQYRLNYPFKCRYLTSRVGVSNSARVFLWPRPARRRFTSQWRKCELAIEEKYDQVRQLIKMGKERGYLLYDEVNDILPAEVHSSEEIDDLLSTFERYGIDVYEDLSSAKAALPADGADGPKSESW